MVITKDEAAVLFSATPGATSAFLYMGRARSTAPHMTYREQTKRRVQLSHQPNGDIYIRHRFPASWDAMWHAAWGMAVDGAGDIHLVHARYKRKEEMPPGIKEVQPPR